MSGSGFSAERTDGVSATTPVLSAEHRHRFRALVAGLNELLDDVRKECPEANYYLANDSFHVLSGGSHDDPGAHARQDRSLECVTLRRSSGGDW
jgi:hypothetical protein